MSKNDNATSILIVEDEAIIGMEIQARLVKLGYDVPVVVDTGEKAIKEAGIMKPDLILMDISLKGDLDGVEVAKNIQQSLSIPVVFLTANTDDQTFQRVKRANPFGYIQKPFQERELHNAIEIALYKSRKEHEVALYQKQLAKAHANLEEKVRERSAQLRQALLDVREANRAREEFLANASHELRTPLNVIIGFSDLMLEAEPGDMVPKFHKYVSHIHDNGGLLLDMVDDLLEFTDLSAGKVALQKVPYDLYDLIQVNTAKKKDQAEDKGLVLGHEIDPLVQRMQEGDPAKLSRVIIKLLDNAVRFTNSGKISLRVETVLEGDEKGFIRICVADTGVGIPEKQLNRILDHFAQADASTTRRYGGMGLGLAIANAIVRLMGSKLCIESQEGKGSVCSFTVPS
ncbi:MAG: response regulator [Desulfobulbaceae bacterium]|nr:response regulator [Desulfobulbaceae bacterium]